MFKNGLILMTALPPTKGHEFLIKFATQYLKRETNDNFLLTVIVNGRDMEPIPSIHRSSALRDACERISPDIEVVLMHGDVPQTPDEHPDFWNIWRELIHVFTTVDHIDYVFASEPYGAQLAAVLEAEFIPCTIERETVKTRATDIRDYPLMCFDALLPEFQQYVRKTITIFGPESVGKTTLSRALALELNGHWVPEWARGYLENHEGGPGVTDAKMSVISYAQTALEDATYNLVDKPFIIKDTDVISTYGYYKLWKGKDYEPPLCLTISRHSDFYILPNDKIPFTPDPLRYGGHKRESDNSFWKAILDKFGLPYYELQSYSREAQLNEAAKFCRNLFNRDTNWKFER